MIKATFLFLLEKVFRMKPRILFLLPALLLAKALTAQPWLEPASQSHNFFRIKAAAESYFSEKSSTAPSGYKPFKRWEAYWSPRVYPDGSFPAPDLAAKEWAAYLQEKSATPRSGGNSNWSSLGPNASPGGYYGIGRVNRITFHPSDSNTFFACTAGGGLWKTADGGSKWVPMTDRLQSLGTSGLVINPNNPDIMYLATGDADAYNTYSFGVLKTLDGGQTWSPTGLYFRDAGWVIYSLVMHPKDENVLMAATNGGIFQTANAGLSWEHTLQNSIFYDIEHKPFSPGTFYAAGSGGIYRSPDSGATWTKVLNLENARRACMTVSPANPEFLGVLVASAKTYGFKGFYASTNGGSSFELRSNTPNILSSQYDGSGEGGQGWYDLCVVASPENPNVIYAGGVNIWKSQDGGVSWDLLTYWHGWHGFEPVPTVHADHHDLLFKNNSTLFVANDGGIYSTQDGGKNWSDLSNTLTISQIYRVSASQSDKKIITGLQDNGTKLYSNRQWTEETGGDGMECAIDPSNESVLYASIQHGRSLYRSLDAGAIWEVLNLDVGDGAWITPFELDPQNPTTLYVGYKRLYKSLNRGKTWSPISDSLMTQGNLITLIALAPSDAKILFIGWEDDMGYYRLAKSVDGGKQWANLPLPASVSYGMSSLAIDPADPTIVYASFSNYAKGAKVFRSTDGGQTWSNFSGSLPNLPANKVLCQKNSNGLVYLAMDVGVFYRDNTMSDWELYSNNLPNVEVFDLDVRYSDGMLIAATYGRGLWQSPVPKNSLSYLDPDPRTLDFPANGGVKIVNVSSNTAWAATDSLSWITLTPTSGRGDTAMAILCQPNSGAKRSGMVFFTGTGANPVRIIVNQERAPGFCDIPKNLRQTGQEYVSVQANWDKVDGATAYTWRYKAVGASQWYQKNDSYNGMALLQAPCSEYLLQVRSVCATVLGEWSPELKLKTSGCADPYCYSYSTYGGTVWVQKVDFAGIQNSSYREFGYKNFTDKVGTVRASFTYPVTLASSDYGLAANTSLYWNVWIDFNQDNDFNDPGELVFSKQAGQIKSITGHIAIPAHAKLGKTRMRVNVSTEPGNTPCSFVGDREVEDYSIEVKSAIVCTPPKNIRLADNGYHWLHAVWDTIPGASSFNYRIKESGATNWQSYGRDTALTGVRLPGLKPCGKYSLQVQAVCPAPPDTVTASDWSETLEVQLSGCDDPYCYSSGNTTLWITRAGLGDLSKISGNDLGYANYTDLAAHVQVGKKYPVSLASNSVPSLPNAVVYWNMWIDFNRDNDFNDPYENVLKKYTPRIASHAGIMDEIRIPLDAQPGKTRMRVSISVEYGDTPCASRLIAREVEDYSLFIQQVVPFVHTAPASIIAPDKGGDITFTIQSNVSWNVLENMPWLSLSPSSGSDSATLLVSCQPNTTDLRSGFISVNGPIGMAQINIEVIQEGSKNPPPANWPFTTTLHRHAILIPRELNASIEGKPLERGDQIGVFYNERCIGYVAWTGGLNYFLVYGDDERTPAKEGPAAGERFTVKVWRESLRLELEAEAVFAPLGYAKVVNASNAFTAGGISAITELRASRSEITDIGLLAERIPSEAIRLYPNPSSGVFLLELLTALRGPFTVRVSSTSGQRVIEQTMESSPTHSTHTLDLSNRPAGVYQVQVLTPDGIWTSLIFKNR